MKACSAGDIRNFIYKQYATHFAAKNLQKEMVPDHFDLLTESIIDSLGVLELIGAIEKEFGLTIDLEGIDAEKITVIGPLSEYIANHAQSVSS